MTMRREELEQIKGIKAELKDIERRLLRPEAQIVPIFYKDYSHGKPQPKTDTGYDDGTEAKKELMRRYRKLQKSGLEKIAQLERELETVNDPITRTVLRKHYFDGASHKEIADELGYSREAITRRINRFFIER